MKTTIILLALLYAVTLNAKDKSKHMALKDSLVGYWNMAQDPGLFPVHDRVFPHRTPLIGVNFDVDENPPTRLVTGLLDKAIWLHGNRTLNAQSNTYLSHQASQFTVGLWWQPRNLVAPSTIFGNGDGEWLATVQTSGGNYYVRLTISEQDLLVSDVPLVVGQFYFITFGWNGTSVWASVNLSARVTVDLAALLPAQPNKPILFNGDGASAYFDDTMIWRRSVSASELDAIYNDGDGLPFNQWDATPKPCRAITACCP